MPGVQGAGMHIRVPSSGRDVTRAKRGKTGNVSEHGKKNGCQTHEVTIHVMLRARKHVTRDKNGKRTVSASKLLK